MENITLDGQIVWQQIVVFVGIGTLAATLITILVAVAGMVQNTLLNKKSNVNSNANNITTDEAIVKGFREFIVQITNDLNRISQRMESAVSDSRNDMRDEFYEVHELVQSLTFKVNNLYNIVDKMNNNSSSDHKEIIQELKDIRHEIPKR